MTNSVNADRIRILFLVRQLEIGGAERQLAALAQGLDRKKYDVSVVSLYAGGRMWQIFESITDVALKTVDKRGRWDIASMMRLASMTRDFRPHIVHGYMSGANQLASIAAWLSGAKSVWGIRVSDQDFSSYTIFRRTVYRLECLMARLPDLIIANSQAGRKAHICDGYPQRSFIVISNGIDTNRFRIDTELGRQWRVKRGFGNDEFLIGFPARIDPMKDHRTFLEAAHRFYAARPNSPVRFLCFGDTPKEEKHRLESEVGGSSEASARIHWLPAEGDMTAVYNALNLVVSTSIFGEGFPNVLGEALACGTPCITTPCGDAKLVVGQYGRIIPFRDAAACASAMADIFSSKQWQSTAWATEARRWIEDRYSVQRMVEASERAFASIL